MNNFGSVENYTRELQKKIARLNDLCALTLPAQFDRNRMSIFAEAFQEVYFDLVDSDLYRLTK